VYLFKARYESGGKIFQNILMRMILALLVFQLFMVGYFGVQGSGWASGCTVPLVVLTIAYWAYMHFFEFPKGDKLNEEEKKYLEAQLPALAEEAEYAYIPKALTASTMQVRAPNNPGEILSEQEGEEKELSKHMLIKIKEEHHNESQEIEAS